MPEISVLLPVRNALPYLGAALASLWRQTFRDFEVIAVDDGSTDGSSEALDRAAAHEPRLRVFHAPHRGLPATLNAALAAARGRLVARQDADDLSHRRRFALQRAHLARDREVAVIGTRIRLFPARAVGAGMRRWASWHNALLTHQGMMRELLIDSPLAHGTAMFRRRRLERVAGWSERGWPEDLDLWIRLAESGARFAKRPEVLYGWRQHRTSSTHTDPRYAPERFLALKREALERGLLARAPAVTVVGVGDSLARWRSALGRGRRTHAIEAGRPAPALVAALAPPVILVFGALPARTRWRATLAATGMVEGASFIFVA